MRSLRLEAELESRIERAAAKEGISVSEFIRRAAAERADLALAAPSTQELLADVIGVAASGPRSDDARRIDELFTEYVVAKHERRRRPTVVE